MTRNAERRPRRKGGVPEIALGNGDSKSITAVAGVPQPRRPGDTCPRCGVPFAWTDLAVLRRCAELARHPQPLRFEDIAMEDW